MKILCAKHDALRSDACPFCVDVDAYAQGRADERAAIVAWLRGLDGFGWIPERLVIRIERGEHEKEKP